MSDGNSTIFVIPENAGRKIKVLLSFVTQGIPVYKNKHEYDM